MPPQPSVRPSRIAARVLSEALLAPSEGGRRRSFLRQKEDLNCDGDAALGGAAAVGGFPPVRPPDDREGAEEVVGALLAPSAAPHGAAAAPPGSYAGDASVHGSYQRQASEYR